MILFLWELALLS